MGIARTNHFYALHAPVYDMSRRLFLPDRERAIDRLDVRRGDRVLDFACGTGLNLRALRSRGAGEIVGIDRSSAMLARARGKDTQAVLVEGDASSVELGPADRALCTYSVSLMENWADVIRNMHRHLRPDGSLVLVDFHRLRGAMGFLAPALDAWLRLFGVTAALPVGDLLRELFFDVDLEIRHAGWDFIAVARGPR